MKKILICGGTGFIGRNLVEYFVKKPDFEVYATCYKRRSPLIPKAKFKRIDLTNVVQVQEIVKGMDVVVQAAATTSGVKDTIEAPYVHVTDNAVMNSLIFRACFEQKVKHVIFLSCTVMYPNQEAPVSEEDMNYQITDNYFGVGWTKVYLEKMSQFYSRIGSAKYTAIRHSNIYGPYDKYDLEKSHVFGATVAKVETAKDGKVVVWGTGAQERDLLYVDDLSRFIDLAIEKQTEKFELVNVGYGKSISIANLVQLIIDRSKKNLKIEYDHLKPSVNFKLVLNIDRAKRIFGWEPQVPLEEGIERSLAWYRKHIQPMSAEKIK